MKFGVREIANVVFRAKSNVKIGGTEFQIGQPVLYIDSAKTSTLEGAATTVYAQGGRGNTRLISWEGEKTLTFTVEDALLSPMGLSILSGAGLIKNYKVKDSQGVEQTTQAHVHTTSVVYVDNQTGKVDLSEILGGDAVCTNAPIFALGVDKDNSLTGKVYKITSFDTSNAKNQVLTLENDAKGKMIMLDYYILKNSANVSEIQIDAGHFAGYYYVEADTLFRRQEDGVDMPAVITLPNVKIQSNFTFSMASTGDPSTFTFTMDAMPGYTYFNRTKQVLCVIQVVEDANAANVTWDSMMYHVDNETIDIDGDNAVDNGEDKDAVGNVIYPGDSYPGNHLPSATSLD